MKSLTFYLTIIAASSLVSCGIMPTNDSALSTHASKENNGKLNAIDDSALTYRAKYGTDYEIHGNVIARYPHFNLSLFRQKSIPSQKGSIYIYELTSKNGLGKTHISCDPRHSEKKHFFLKGLHFYYHSNSEGAINIYMPPQLLAHR